MTPIAELTAMLMAAGLPAEQVTHALDLAQQHADAQSGIRRQSADESAERRRAADRERQRKLREIRRQSADNPQIVTPPLTLSSSRENLEVKKEEKKVRARKAPNAPLSADWQPTTAHFAAAEKLKIPISAVHSKAEDMRIWAKSSGALKADWDATFHGFLRRDAEKLNGNVNGKRTVQQAAADLHERVSLFERPAPDELRDGTGQAHVRLLPAR